MYRTIILTFTFLVISSKLFCQNFQAKTLLQKAIYQSLTSRMLTCKIELKLRNIGDQSTKKMLYKIIKSQNDSFLMNTKAQDKPKIENFIIEYNDSSFLFEINLKEKSHTISKQKIRRGIKNSNIVRRSLGLQLDSSHYVNFSQTITDTVVNGIECWILTQDKLETTFSTISESLIFISKKDSLYRGYSLTEVFNSIDTVYSESFIVSLSFDQNQITNDIVEFESNLRNSLIKYPLMLKEVKTIGSAKMKEKRTSFQAYNIMNKDSVIINVSEGKFVLDFWYIGCLPCMSGMPYLDSLESIYSGKAIHFIKINAVDYEDLNRTTAYCKKHSMKNNVYLTNGNLLLSLGVEVYPTYLFIDNGKIVKKMEGFNSNINSEMKLFLKQWTQETK